jgi:NAD(P)-dependent dehydrogenase (short-subunit alcohol dehydrogenase family)
MSSKTVLIIGYSTGIDHDLAQRLARANYTVVVTARHPKTISELPVALRLPQEVTDPISIASAT